MSRLDLEPAGCSDPECEADHGYTGTASADDIALRVSEAAEGADAVARMLGFAAALSRATGAVTARLPDALPDPGYGGGSLRRRPARGRSTALGVAGRAPRPRRCRRATRVVVLLVDGLGSRAAARARRRGAVPDRPARRPRSRRSTTGLPEHHADRAHVAGHRR